MSNGAFTFVLHSHLPYARLAGRWPHGEEWIHEAASETYIPLLEIFHQLIADDISFRVTLGITPILAEQLADETVLANFDDYLDMNILAAKKDMALYAPPNITSFENIEVNRPEDTTGDEHLYYLANWYREYYERIKHLFNDTFNRDIIGAFRQLQDDGYLEIMTSAATHAYLPLLKYDSSIRAQIAIGVQSYERLFGRKPKSFWLPECAYRPAYVDENGTTRLGIEALLAEKGIQAFFTETHAITGGHPVGIAAGDILGPYGDIKRRYVIPPAKEPMPKRDTTTFKAYYARNTADMNTDNISSGVAVIGRNNTTGQQVWSEQWGYPGDFDYREFHKKAGSSGLRYWRVTGDNLDLGEKQYYQPDWAAIKIEQHAEHFAHLVGDLLRDYHTQTGDYGLIASNYDTELFGHWWFEGVPWLKYVLKHLAHYDEIDLVTVSDYLEHHPPQETLHVPESSWGAGGNHFTWDNGETHWMWEPIHNSEQRMQDLAKQFITPSDDEVLVLNQAAREVLLMQSSDWAFLVTTGQAREYAIQRFTQHVERFNQLATSLENNAPKVGLAQEYFELDNIFADINYAIFRD
ncbi:MAG: 1,4-alpha-glucan branching protein domain-containing protein [Phototrophicaceae bacterium]